MRFNRIPRKTTIIVLVSLVCLFSYGQQNIMKSRPTIEPGKIDRILLELDRAVAAGDSSSIVQLSISLAGLYEKLFLFASADSLYRRILQVVDTVNSSEVASRIYFGLGQTSAYMNRSEAALNYYEKSLSLAPSDSMTRYVVYERLAEVLFNLRDFEKANKYIDKSIENNPSSFKYPQYLVKSSILLNLRNYIEADKFALLSLEGYEKDSITQGICHSLTNLGTISYMSGDEKRALDYYNRALEISVKENVFESISRASFFLSRFYESTGNWELSLAYFKKYSAYKDSVIHESSSLSNIILPDDSLIVSQNHEIQRLNKQKMYVIWVSGFIIMGALIFLLSFRLRAKQRENNLIQQIHRIQINPHFIFNSLNTLQGFIIEKELALSNKYLTQFSRLIRSILGNTLENYITISDEVQFLKDYLALESLRFNNSIDYSFEIHPDIHVYHCMIPTMIIQPLVENSIWHGLVPKVGSGCINIKFMPVVADTIKCVITDNGIGRYKSQLLKKDSNLRKNEMGTTLIKDRLNTFSKIHKRKYTIEYEDLYEDGIATGTVVYLLIPVKWKREEK